MLEFSQANKPLSQKVKTKRVIWFLSKSLKINAIIDKMYQHFRDLKYHDGLQRTAPSSPMETTLQIGDPKNVIKSLTAGAAFFT